ncbi:helix-turn-helix transcriptional regulator [Streptomyces sp. NBC_00513]|uniref:response regulator transcription factor n=1 Tax=unclassified Streptomyces TaxID=2593676 RepID=UPI0022563044|nr:helix-turn-helix transcriptional regulator [Streptomyces sp. NBC_00424]MCX5071193.1 helix-turn-helix transcriptional regulator [Streptomyces sp. NBC_00424]WUD45391.1 helix-turn-helix transcriptional regulator [Streptomyces sp. NBC_00513]
MTELRVVLRATSAVSTAVAIDAADLEVLTARERHVLWVLGGGESNRLLARRLGIAERTVKAHITSITRKLDLTSRVEATLVSLHHHELLAGDPAVS